MCNNTLLARARSLALDVRAGALRVFHIFGPKSFHAVHFLL